MKIRVSIIEDDARWRAGLERILNGSAGFACASVHPSSEHALDGLPAAAPHVVLVDLALPGLSGVDCVRRLKPLCRDTAFVILSAHEDTRLIFESLQAGASGYLLKRTPPAQLLEAITDVHRGGAPMSSAIARRIVDYFHGRPSPPKELEQLTHREEQILRNLEEGLSYEEIATVLGICYDTVRAHLRSIYDKLHVHSRGEAVAVYHKRLA